MPQFIYMVRDKEGREHKNIQEVASQEELVNRLQGQGLLVISIARQDVAEKKTTLTKRLHLRVTMDDMIIFTRQLSTMLDAGVTLLKSLEVLSRQIESRTLLKAVQTVKRDIAAGSTFRDALAKHPGIFSDFWVHVVETGEASGTLPVALAQLADYLESSAAMRRKVTSALIYPAILIFMVTLTLLVFTVWVIPVFDRIFQSFDTQLPWITRAVITLSEIARRYLLVFFAGGAALVYFLHRYLKTEKGRLQFDQFKLKLPALGPLFQRIAIERFAGGLGTLIESGVPILYGLDIISKAVESKVMEQAIGEVRESVRRGKGMTRPMEESHVFTPMVVQMVAVGEEIGELSKMLKKVSDFYKERIATTLERISTLIEPAILIFMGVVVLIIVVAMFLPIFQLAVVARGG